MNGRYLYFAFTSLLAVLCSFVSFPLFFLVTVIYCLLLVKYKHFSSAQLLSIIGIFLLLLISSRLALVHNKTKIPVQKAVFELTFDQDPKIDGDRLEILAREVTSHEKILLHYKINSESEKQSLLTRNFFGKLCKVTGTLSQPKRAKNENAFNYREYLQQKQVFWILDSNQMPLKNCRSVKLSLPGLIKQIRFYGIKNLYNHFPPQVAALASALIYGDQSLIDPETLENYQKIGITHLLAISGLQASLCIGMVFYLGIRLGGTREAVINLLLIILPVYAVLTGATPSVVRAVVMIFLVMATIKWKTSMKLLPIDTISLAFCLFLLFNPFSLFDIGFQLSFSVTIVIIMSSPIILKRYHNAVSRILATTLTAQIASLPSLLYHFYGVSLISIVANLVYIPLYSFVFLPCVYIFAIWQLIIGIVPMPIMNLFANLVSLSGKLSEMLARLSAFDFIPGRPSGLELIIYIVGLLLILIIWEHEYWRRNRIPVILLCCFLATFQTVCNQINPAVEVTMIDVGQGDSFLIHLPFNKGNYLIDTGGTLSFNEENWRKRANPFEVGKDVVVPFLKSKGIRKIDKLILTHGDTDHIGGALAVLNEIKIGQIMLPLVANLSDSEKKIVQIAGKKGIPVYDTSTGDHWKAGGSTFFILSPEKNFSGESNMSSVVVYATIGGLNWFFGGDLPKEGEEKIIKEHPNLSVDVLKVGHHGSNTSSSELFLQRVKPKIALISVGEKNRYGHPHQEVINSLTKIGAGIYRTDQQGEVSYHFYHGKGTFSHFLP